MILNRPYVEVDCIIYSLTCIIIESKEMVPGKEQFDSRFVIHSKFSYMNKICNTSTGSVPLKIECFSIGALIIMF